jgi:hypothetical protein
MSATTLIRKGFPAHCQTATATSSTPLSHRAPTGRTNAGANYEDPGQLGPRIRYTSSPENQAKTMDAKPEENAAPSVINGRINGRFAKGSSGNPGGSPEATRRAFNKDFLVALARDFQAHGEQVLARVRRESPATYLKVCAMLVPRELKVEHSGGVKSMTDEQIEQAIEAIQAMLAARAPGDQARVIEGVAEPAALPAPPRKAKRKRGAEAKASPCFPTSRAGANSSPARSVGAGEAPGAIFEE